METLDCRGQLCPDPLNNLRAALRKMKSGEAITILSDDLASEREIPSFCRFVGHTLQAMPHDGNCTYIVVKK